LRTLTDTGTKKGGADMFELAIGKFKDCCAVLVIRTTTTLHYALPVSGIFGLQDIRIFILI
jgi:hypothetical protein